MGAAFVETGKALAGLMLRFLTMCTVSMMLPFVLSLCLGGEAQRPGEYRDPVCYVPPANYHVNSQPERAPLANRDVQIADLHATTWSNLSFYLLALLNRFRIVNTTSLLTFLLSSTWISHLSIRISS